MPGCTSGLGKPPCPPTPRLGSPPWCGPGPNLPSGYQWLAVPKQLWVLSGEMEACPLLHKEQLTRPGAPALSPLPSSSLAQPCLEAAPGVAGGGWGGCPCSYQVPKSRTLSLP